MTVATTVIAGLDIGNSTTELIVAQLTASGPQPMWHGQSPQTDRKGSPASLRTAAALILTAETELGRICDLVVTAHIRPVDTQAATAGTASRAPAVIVDLVRSGAGTPAGGGSAVGIHVPLADLATRPATADDLIVSVPAGVDFEDAAAALASEMLRGQAIVGVLVDQDDGVLIANRLPRNVPVVDEVRISELLPGVRVAVEVVPPGSARRRFADLLAVAAALHLDHTQFPAIAAATRELADAAALALIVAPAKTSAPEPESSGFVDCRIDAAPVRLTLEAARDVLRRSAPGTATALTINSVTTAVSDVSVVDLAAVDDGVWLRRGLADLTAVLVASLATPLVPEVKEQLQELTGRKVVVLATEHHAAAVGARSTPALPADAAVCDIGGGTVDLVWGEQSQTAAGAGELVTLAVATALDIPRALAERVKRTASVHVESPHLAHEEDGRRTFLPAPAPAEVIGRLCHREAAELLPFNDSLAAEEWRSLRLALKRETVAANVERCLKALTGLPAVLVLAGGGALDDELVRTVSESLRADGVTVGRADVAARFGPRYAVAWGLVQIGADAPMGIGLDAEGTA